MDKLYEVRDRIEAGAPPRDATRTVGNPARDWRRPPWPVRSKGDYQGALREPGQAPGDRAVRCLRLDRLRPSDIEALVLKMRASTKPAKTEVRLLRCEHCLTAQSGRSTPSSDPASTVQCAMACWP